MRAWLWVVLFLAGCLRPAPPPATPFTALSFNIRYGTAEDGPDAWPLRRESVANLLVQSGAELIGLQEALDFQLEYLDRVLVHHRRVGQGREGGSLGEHCAIYFDTRRFELLESHDRWLSPTPEQVGSVGWDAALTRIVSFARFRDRSSGTQLCVWNTHWDHRGVQAREESARYLARCFAQETGPRLLLGDLNTGERTPPLDVLRAAGWRDSYRDAQAQHAAVGTFHAFRGGREGEKIDYCLVDASLRTLEAEILDVRGLHGRYPSDHHAVSARLDYQRSR